MMTAAPRGYDQGGDQDNRGRGGGGGGRQDPRMFRNGGQRRGSQNQQQQQRGGSNNFNNQRQQQQQQNQGQDGQQQQQNQGAQPINLRIILTKDEVSYLFGFDGVLINQLRQQTGANIQITDPNVSRSSRSQDRSTFCSRPSVSSAENYMTLSKKSPIPETNGPSSSDFPYPCPSAA